METSDVEMTNEQGESTRMPANSAHQGHSLRAGASADKDQAMKTVVSSSNQAKDVAHQVEKNQQKPGSNQGKSVQKLAYASQNIHKSSNVQSKAMDSKQPKKRDDKAAQKQIAAKPAGSQLSASPSKQDELQGSEVKYKS